MTFYSSLEQSIFYKNSKGDMTPRDNDEKESWLFSKTFFHFSFSSSFLIIFLVLWVSILPDYSCGTDSWNQGFGYLHIFCHNWMIFQNGADRMSCFLKKWQKVVVYLYKIGRKPRIIKTVENTLCIAFWLIPF